MNSYMAGHPSVNWLGCIVNQCNLRINFILLEYVMTLPRNTPGGVILLRFLVTFCTRPRKTIALDKISDALQLSSQARHERQKKKPNLKRDD